MSLNGNVVQTVPTRVPRGDPDASHGPLMLPCFSDSSGEVYGLPALAPPVLLILWFLRTLGLVKVWPANNNGSETSPSAASALIYLTPLNNHQQMVAADAADDRRRAWRNPSRLRTKFKR